jgi:hypothetical protein
MIGPFRCNVWKLPIEIGDGCRLGVDRFAYQRFSIRQINRATDRDDEAQIGRDGIEPPGVERLPQSGGSEAGRVCDHPDSRIGNQMIEGVARTFDAMPPHRYGLIIARSRDADTTEAIEGLGDDVLSGRAPEIEPWLGKPIRAHAGTFGLLAKRFCATRLTISGRRK